MSDVPAADLPLEGDPCAEFLRSNHLPPSGGQPTLQAYWQALPWETR